MRSPFHPPLNPDRSSASWSMVRFLGGFILGLALAVGVPAAWALTADVASVGIAGYQVPSPFAPGDPEVLTMPGSAGLATTSTITGKCLRVSCSTAASFRVGTSSLAYVDGGANVTASYNQMAASTPETMCLTGSQTTLAFYTAESGSCYIAVRGP